MLAAGAAAGVLVLFGGLSQAVAPREARASVRVRQGPELGSSAAAPAPPTAQTGAWTIQVGAFRNAAGARERLRAIGSQVPELRSLAAQPQARGPVTRARIGGIASKAEAASLCARIARAGRGCFVVAPGT